MTHTATTLTEFLRPPITQERPWVVFAACRDADPDLFFPGSKAAEAAAKALCAMCPVRYDCHEYSLEARESFGVWGGLNEKQRRMMLRRIA